MSQRRGSWAKYQTEEGYDYYYDEDTQNSQWERPNDYASDHEGEEISTNEIILEDHQNYDTQQMENNDQIFEGYQENYRQDVQQVYNNFEYSTPDPVNSISVQHLQQEEDSLYFDYDASSSLFDELSRLTLFQPLSSLEKTYLRSGMWCKISCRKLEILQMCLENYGTEDEWKVIFSKDDWIVMRYLMKFIHPSAHPVLQDAAVRCLAYAHMPYPKVWVDYLHAMDKPSPIHMYRVTYIAVERIKMLIDMPPEDKPLVPYAGFDIRDVHDFNLENLEEYNLSGEKGTKGPFDMIGATDVATTIAVWLLLLFEIFRVPSRLIGDDFRRRRIALLGMLRSSNRMTPGREGGGGTEGGEEGTRAGDEDYKSTTENFLEMVTDLLTLSNKLKESSYLLCLKVIAAINWQIPSKDLVGSTEIAEICAKLQFSHTDTSPVNVSEGLLHLLNDIGYPNHKLPETLPTLQLCYDLITTSEYEGFFYVNDLKVIIEVIIRELSNLPWDEESWNPQRCDDETNEISHGELIVFDGLNGPMEGIANDALPYNELVRQMYLKLTTALVTRTNWSTLENYYKKSDLDRVLQWWLDNGMVSCPTTIELVSEVLEKKLGAI